MMRKWFTAFIVLFAVIAIVIPLAHAQLTVAYKEINNVFSVLQSFTTGIFVFDGNLGLNVVGFGPCEDAACIIDGALCTNDGQLYCCDTSENANFTPCANSALSGVVASATACAAPPNDSTLAEAVARFDGVDLPIPTALARGSIRIGGMGCVAATTAWIDYLDLIGDPVVVSAEDAVNTITITGVDGVTFTDVPNLRLLGDSSTEIIVIGGTWAGIGGVVPDITNSVGFRMVGVSMYSPGRDACGEISISGGSYAISGNDFTCHKTPDDSTSYLGMITIGDYDGAAEATPETHVSITNNWAGLSDNTQDTYAYFVHGYFDDTTNSSTVHIANNSIYLDNGTSTSCANSNINGNLVNFSTGATDNGGGNVHVSSANNMFWYRNCHKGKIFFVAQSDAGVGSDGLNESRFTSTGDWMYVDITDTGSGDAGDADSHCFEGALGLPQTTVFNGGVCINEGNAVGLVRPFFIHGGCCGSAQTPAVHISNYYIEGRSTKSDIAGTTSWCVRNEADSNTGAKVYVTNTTCNKEGGSTIGTFGTVAAWDDYHISVAAEAVGSELVLNNVTADPADIFGTKGTGLFINALFDIANPDGLKSTYIRVDNITDTTQGPVDFPRGFAHVGPLAMVALAADNHGQPDTYTDFLTLVDQYNIPFTVYVERFTGGLEAMTDAQLAAMVAHPLFEVGSHGGVGHSSPNWQYGGQGEFVTNDNTIFVHAPPDGLDVFGAVGDMIWAYGISEPLSISALTNATHAEVTDRPLRSHAQSFYHLDLGTESIGGLCDGTTDFTIYLNDDCTADDLPVDCCTAADTGICGDTLPGGSITQAPSWGGTGKGGMLYSEDAAPLTEGNTYYIMDIDLTDTCSGLCSGHYTLNRTCTISTRALDIFRITSSFEGTINTITDNIAEIRSDSGVADLEITSWGAPHNAQSAPQSYQFAARGFTGINSGGGDANTLAVPYGSFNPYSIPRIFVDSFMAPQSLRNMLQAVIDAKSIMTWNLESTANPALFAKDAALSGTAGNSFVDCATCTFQTDALIAINDTVVIDDSQVEMTYIVSAVTSETRLTLTLPLNSGLPTPDTFTNANFWIIDAATSGLVMPFESNEVLWKFLDENRDKIVAVTMKELTERAMILRGLGAMTNIVQNPYFRITHGREYVPDDGGDSGDTPFLPWTVAQSGSGDGLTVVERFGQRMLKMDTGGANISMDISQNIYLKPNTEYVVWIEVEVESMVTRDLLYASINRIQGAISQKTLQDEIKSSGSNNRNSLAVGNTAIRTEVLHFRFSTKPPEMIWLEVDQGDGDTALSFDESVGFYGATAFIFDDSLANTRIEFPGSVRPPTFNITQLEVGTLCIPDVRSNSRLDIICRSLEVKTGVCDEDTDGVCDDDAPSDCDTGTGLCIGGSPAAGEACAVDGDCSACTSEGMIGTFGCANNAACDYTTGTELCTAPSGMSGTDCDDADTGSDNDTACDVGIGDLYDTDFHVQVFPYPTHSGVNSMLQKMRASLRIRFDGEGVIYIKPPLILEYHGSF